MIHIAAEAEALMHVFEPFVAIESNEVLFKFKKEGIEAVGIDFRYIMLVSVSFKADQFIEYSTDEREVWIEAENITKAISGIAKSVGKHGEIVLEIGDDFISLIGNGVGVTYKGLPVGGEKRPTIPAIVYNTIAVTERSGLMAAIKTIESVWGDVEKLACELVSDGTTATLSTYDDGNNRKNVSVVLGPCKGKENVIVNAGHFKNIIEAMPDGTVELAILTDSPLRIKTIAQKFEILTMVAPRVEP